MQKLIDFLDTNPNEIECVKFLEGIYWNNTPISPFDAKSKVYITKRGYRCKNTSKYFNVRNNTLFESAITPLSIWFKAIAIYQSENSGKHYLAKKTSSYKLASAIDIGQKSAWLILDKIKREQSKFLHFINLVL